MTNQTVTIYTDGGCSPNPGPGGWAAILRFPGREPQELVGAVPDTTNNQMELQAAIEAFKALPAPHQVDLYTDSQYLRQGISQWLPNWEATGWRTSQKTAVKNQALWQELAALLHQHEVIWHWTKGHAGDKWNERADELARSAIPRAALPLDDQDAIHLFTAASYLGKQKKWWVGRRASLSRGGKDSHRNSHKYIRQSHAFAGRHRRTAGYQTSRAHPPLYGLRLSQRWGHAMDGAMAPPQLANKGWQTGQPP